jgi:uncharacterized protein
VSKIKPLAAMNYVIATIMIGVIQLYRWTLSPFMGRFCRFQPTCSIYTLDAIKLHGPWAGGWLGVKRICRCHPAGGFGFDPVPQHVMKRAAPHDMNASSSQPK